MFIYQWDIWIVLYHKVTLFYLFWHPLWQHWPVVRHSESSDRDVVTLGAELQQHKEVRQEGGGEGQLSSGHETQFVPLHQQPAEENPHRHRWQVQHTWSKNVEDDHWWKNTKDRVAFLQAVWVWTPMFLISVFSVMERSSCVSERTHKNWRFLRAERAGVTSGT